MASTYYNLAASRIWWRGDGGGCTGLATGSDSSGLSEDRVVEEGGARLVIPDGSAGNDVVAVVDPQPSDGQQGLERLRASKLAAPVEFTVEGPLRGSVQIG